MAGPTAWSLVSIETDGGEQAALAVGDGYVVPGCLRGYGSALEVVHNWERLAPELATVDPAECEPVTCRRLLRPLAYPSKVLCSGPNFHDHLAEMGESGLGPSWTPYFFLKPPTTTVIAHEAAVEVSGDPADKVDWEGELAVVIARGGRDIPVASALQHCAGYTVANDISLRGPHRRDTPAAPFQWDWLASKAADTSLPLGPGIVPVWQVPDVQDLRIRTWVNDELMQDGSTADMVCSVAELVSHASRRVTLEPGDVLATGTPAGVGAARGRFLAPGDVVRVTIDGIGTLQNPVRQRQER